MANLAILCYHLHVSGGFFVDGFGGVTFNELLLSVIGLLAFMATFRSFFKSGLKAKKPRRPLPRKGPFRVKSNPLKQYRSPRPDYEAKARARAAEQRLNAPAAETAFNETLRNLGFVENVDYKWQDLLFYPGGYAIIDFPFWRQKVLFEVDGSSHDEPGQRNHDIGRDAYCRAQGFKVVRIKNRMALHDHNLCREIILAELKGR
jgi:very-short-patch-repair endonuclease